MTIRIAVLASLLCLAADLPLAAQKMDTAAAERYIAEGERQWAASTASGDTQVIDRIIAEDFVGVDTDGSLYDKAKQLAQTRDSPRTYLSNHLNYVKVRFFGETAVAQGSESWERRTGTPKRGRFVWTDVWVMRRGKWQIISATDVLAPETAAAHK